MAPGPSFLRYRCLAQVGEARAGVFDTPHGEVPTPAFMPVATRASVKGLTPAQLEAIDPGVVLANAYHLHLRPGAARVAALGGLHGFTGLRRPWLTDSGGFQVYSLTDRVRVRDDHVELRSHLDGTPLRLGPRESMAIQAALGADLVMAFDHCVGLPAPRAEVAAAVERTTRWARICRAVAPRDDQALLGIVQGGTDPELRERSLADLLELELPGYALGGLAVGEAPAALWATVHAFAPRLPADRPRYLMGLGPPPDLLAGIAAGVDLFDCVLPTRLGRRGWLYTRDGVVRIAAREHAASDAPLDPECGCEVCRRCPRAWLRHLFQVGEHAAVTLGTLHNLTFTVALVREARARILDGSFAAWRAAFDARWQAGEAAWRRRHAEDPDGARRSREARVSPDG